MNIIELIQKVADGDTIWINTKKFGAQIADVLESKGIAINRFICCDRPPSCQREPCDSDENLQ
jgi:hypothetical protein